MPNLLVHDGAAARSAEPGELAALLASGATLWIDVESSDPALPSLLAQLKLHPLVIEDIVRDRPSPKVEDYCDYLYIVAHGLSGDANVDPEALPPNELDLVLGPTWVLTHHRGPSPTVLAVRTELEKNSRALVRGPAFVAHALLDQLVDSYLPGLDVFDDAVEAVQQEVVHDPTPEVLQRIFRLKRALQHLRRTALHQRELLLRLSRGEFDRIPEAALPFFRDVHDHALRVADLSEGYRELLAGALDAYLSVVSVKMNQVMKTLTIVATIFLPITFIVGVYGMNFHIPEYSWRWGYLYVWLLLVGVTAGMLLWFRSRRWL